MKRMRTGSGPALILLLCVIAGAAVLSGCEKDSTTGPGTSGGDPAEELIATQAQAGLWEWNMVLKDCTTQEVVQQGSYSDTLCVGESVNPESEGEWNPVCTVTRETNGYLLHCTYAQPEGECTMNFTIDMHFRFTNTEKTAATVTGQVAMHFTGTGCEGVPDQCMTLNLTGSKVGPVPAGGCS